MATWHFSGLAKYERMLSNLGSVKTTRKVCGVAIYAGAGVVADEIRRGIDALPVVSHNKRGTPADPLEGITSAQKTGLQDGFGVSRMTLDNGFYNVKVGFDGYNSVETKSYPFGQPNAMIARSVNSGASFRRKIPFVDNAVRAAKGKAEKAMKIAFENEMNKEIGGK